MYESRSDRDICAELAPRLGITDYREGRTDIEWLKAVSERASDIPDFEEFKKQGVVRIAVERPYVAFREQVKDPDNNPFPTVSGKIEIYCPHLAEMNNHQIPPVAKYLTTPEGFGVPLSRKYPLQLMTTHHKTAAHSTYEKMPWLDEVEPRRIWISTRDAEMRSICDGDEVMVFNDRGKVMIKARVTERIMLRMLSCLI